MLYFLSKTDTSIIKHCPPSAKNVQATFGFFVLLTGVMAFFSGSYAISNMFIEIDPLTERPFMIKHGWLYSFLIGAVYACFIMAIDREIVSANNKFSAVLRVPLAIVIGLIVSVPVELQIFESKIIKHLQTSHNLDRDSNFSKLENQFKLPEIRQKIKDIETKRQAAINSKAEWANAMEAEVVGRSKAGRTGLAGKGDAYYAAEDNRKLQDSLIRIYDQELQFANSELTTATSQKNSAEKIEKVNQSYDLLSKYIALKEVKIADKTGSAKRIGFGLTVLFCLFEIIPSLMKLLSSQTEYDVLLSRRTRLNMAAAKEIYNNAVADYSNMGLDEIGAYNHSVVKKMYESQSY